MAGYFTGYMPIFMGLDSWTLEQGLIITPSPPTPQGKVAVASNGKARCAAFKYNDYDWGPVVVCEYENATSYMKTTYSPWESRSQPINTVYGDNEFYYTVWGIFSTAGVNLWGWPAIGLYDSLEAALADYTHIDEDPFSPGGTSTIGGGGMTGDTPPHDDIDFPNLPTISAANAGMVSIWVPTLSELQRFAAYLWNTNILTSGFWKNLVSSPIDLFYGLNIMPVPIDRTQVHTDTVTFGWIDTEIMWDYIDDQYIEIDCGSLDMNEYWKAYLDYAPYTKIDIYLPYIGVRHLNTNDLMDKTIYLKYVIDLGSGACVAMIKSDDSVLYHFAGNCATPVPVSSIQFQEIVRNITSTAVSAVGGILGAAVSPALGAGGMAGVVTGAIKTFTTDHATVNRSGAMGSSSGLMGVQTPYLIITRPRMAIPENQNTYTGYPSFITEQIGDLIGYTEIEIIHMHNMSCTEEEFNEIEELLLKGVIL